MKETLSKALLVLLIVDVAVANELIAVAEVEEEGVSVWRGWSALILLLFDRLEKLGLW